VGQGEKYNPQLLSELVGNVRLLMRVEAVSIHRRRRNTEGTISEDYNVKKIPVSQSSQNSKSQSLLDQEEKKYGRNRALERADPRNIG
jgi:hypothetical protein